jgi:hypothetical protein
MDYQKIKLKSHFMYLFYPKDIKEETREEESLKENALEEDAIEMEAKESIEQGLSRH